MTASVGESVDRRPVGRSARRAARQPAERLNRLMARSLDGWKAVRPPGRPLIGRLEFRLMFCRDAPRDLGPGANRFASCNLSASAASLGAPSGRDNIHWNDNHSALRRARLGCNNDNNDCSNNNNDHHHRRRDNRSHLTNVCSRLIQLATTFWAPPSADSPPRRDPLGLRMATHVTGPHGRTTNPCPRPRPRTANEPTNPPRTEAKCLASR